MIKSPLAPECISLRANRATAPLSFNQESLWFWEQLNPNTSTYNLSDAMRIRGPLHLAAVQQTLETIVARHDTLRTTFGDSEWRTAAIHCEHQAVKLQFLAAPSEAEARRILAAEAERPFDLARGPLVRFTLVQLREDEHVLLLLLHHIISDGWSVGVFWQEFAQIYESLAWGQSRCTASVAASIWRLHSVVAHAANQ